MFGKPREGVHSIRVLDVAVVDLLLTILVASLIAYLMKWSYLWTNLGAIALGIGVHRAFCVNTKLNTLIFGRVNAVPPETAQ